MSINPKFHARFGNKDDLVYLERLLTEVKDHKTRTSKPWSYPFDDKDFSIDQFVLSIEKQIGDTRRSWHKLALVFDEAEEIKCISLATFWTTIKSWRQGLIICKPENTFFDAVENGIADSSNMIVEYAESIGYYTYDFIIANPRNSLRWHRMREQIPLIRDRYNFYDDAIIPANTLPRHPRFQEMMRFRSWNIDLLYRIGHLKNEFRNPELLIDPDSSTKWHNPSISQ